MTLKERRTVLGALLDVFGLGSRAGRVCAACVPQSRQGFFTVRFFECLCYLCAHRSFVRSSEGCNINNTKTMTRDDEERGQYRPKPIHKLEAAYFLRRRTKWWGDVSFAATTGWAKLKPTDITPRRTQCLESPGNT